MRRLFIMRKDLHMSAGKLLAQTLHCVEAYWTNMIRGSNVTKGHISFNEDETVDIYDTGVEFDYVKEHETPVYIANNIIINKRVYEEYINGTFTKTVCEAKNKNHLLKARDMAEEMGLVEGYGYGLIYDKCLTELTPEEEDGTTLTGIWFCPLPDEQAHAISKKYQLYK